jgi:signal transduction histidine kinase
LGREKDIEVGIMENSLKEQIQKEFMSLGRSGSHREMITLCKNYLEDKAILQDQFRVYLYRAIGNSYFYLAEYDEALIWHQLSLDSIDVKDDHLSVAKANVGLGGCYFHKNNLDKATLCFETAISEFKKLDDRRGAAFTYNWLGIIYNEQGKLYESLEVNLLAFRGAKEFNIIPLLATVSNSLGLIFFHLRDSEKALHYYTLAAGYNQQTKNLMVEADILNNMAMVYRRQERFDKSIDIFNQAIDIRLEHFPGDIKRLGHCYSNLAEAELNSNKIEDAMRHFINAVECYNKLEDNLEHLQRQYCQIAIAALQMDDDELALEYLHKYDENEKILGTEINKDLYYHSYSVYYSKTKQYEKAIDTLQKFTEIQLLDAKKYTKKAVEDINVRIDFEKKQAEAELYKVKNVELVEANKTKDKLLSIIAHDLRGPIANIVEVMKILVDEGIDEVGTNNILADLLKDTTEVYKLLQNLLAWARNQIHKIEPEFSEICMDNLANEIAKQSDYIIRNKELTVNYSTTTNSCAYADANLVSFIVRNLISNAVKFTEKGGKIVLTTEQIDDHIIISVCDNGVGIPEEKLNTIFEFSTNKSTRGTENEKGTGLGLLLCGDFAKLNNGSLRVNSELGKGSCFRMKLPIMKD